MDIRLYLSVGTSVRGPLELERIRRLHESGRLPPGCKVSADRKRWIPVSTAIYPPRTVPKAPETTCHFDGTDRRQSHCRHDEGTADAGDGFRVQTANVWILDTGPGAASLLSWSTLTWAVTLVTFPLMLLWAVNVAGVTIGQTVWLASGYYCTFFALLIRFVLRVDGRRWRTGLGYALFTAFVGIPVLYLWHNLPILRPYAELLETSTSWAGQFVGFTVSAGLLEEGCKLLPLIFIGMRRGGIRSPADGLWLGIMSGLGFAWAEGVNYTATYWGSSVVDQIAILSQGTAAGAQESAVIGDMMIRCWEAFMAQQTRFLTLPMLHGGFAAIAGSAAAFAYLNGRWWVLLAGWMGAALLHGLYNSLVGGMGGIITAACVVIILFVLADGTRQGGGVLRTFHRGWRTEEHRKGVSHGA